MSAADQFHRTRPIDLGGLGSEPVLSGVSLPLAGRAPDPGPASLARGRSEAFGKVLQQSQTQRAGYSAK
jgi:hypothetical protein